MDKLTMQLSNVMQVAFLITMITVALIRLTDGRKKQMIERISLFLISAGGFFQLEAAAHPPGNSIEILVTHAGVAMWMAQEAYKYYQCKGKLNDYEL